MRAARGLLRSVFLIRVPCACVLEGVRGSTSADSRKQFIRSREQIESGLETITPYHLVVSSVQL